MLVKINYPHRFFTLITEENVEYAYKGILDSELKELFRKEVDAAYVDDFSICEIEEEKLKKMLPKALMKVNFNVQSYKEYIEKLNEIINEIRTYTEMSVNIEDYIEYGEPIQIFISHSSQTDAIAEAFVELLIKHKIDKNNVINIHNKEYLELLPSSEYIYPINEYIQKSEVFVSIMDKNFLKSQMCNVEIGMALSSGALLLPVFESLPNRNKDRLFKNRHIDFITDKRYLRKMISLMDRTPQDDLIDEFINKINV